MNRIITVGREFGSGGRELAKRLADKLQIAYYDHEILLEISKKTSLAEEYVRQVVEHKPSMRYPITIGHTLHSPYPDYILDQQNAIYASQTEVIREMATKSDCVIVGRCADHILRDLKPLRLFISADLEARVERCRRNAEENERFSDKQLRQMILKVDKGRARYYHNYTGQKWGDRENYDICINTTHLDIKQTVEALATMLS